MVKWKAAQKAWYERVVKERRRKWFAENGPCVDCGTWDNLELDHVDPSTKVSHTVWSWGDAKRLEELEKCKARCHGCHLEKTKRDLRAMDANAHLRRIDPPGMAWCYGHQDWLPVGDFTKDRSKRRGLETDCRECRQKRRSPKKYEKLCVGGPVAKAADCKSVTLRANTAGSTPAQRTIFYKIPLDIVGAG